MFKTPLSIFDYHLPQELIAQYPAKERDLSRLLILDRQRGNISETVFSDITDVLDNNYFLVVNNTQVLKARLLGEKKSGGKVEILLLDDKGCNRFSALIKGRVKEGTIIDVGSATVEVEELLEDGFKQVIFKDADPYKIMEKYGHVPLPPYIKRKDEGYDAKRYQTVYSKTPGSVAAPTAGLHFTDNIIQRFINKGVEVIEITLKVGAGTFCPMRTVFLEDHIMHPEQFEISKDSKQRINRLKSLGKKLVAVGTTTMRALEAASNEKGIITKNGVNNTNLFIKPGYTFKVVDTLITNFHLPESTLFILVSVFGGEQRIRKAYNHAILNKFRFYSYGDAMLII